ncbi:MAG TPA: T9SS type A sorting domain-containing protein, partial [Saprospiraceae bacterium]|nr:T9SS type A sorting domain-containing protein [Saprospiraceae bacterium]
MKNKYLLLIVWLLLARSIFSQGDSCRANTWIKLLGKPGTHERGAAMCPAGDGNLYITGQKPDSAVILKISPDGDILRARSFDFFPGYDNITYLNLDSDGMLLGCAVSCTCLTGFHNSCFFKYNPQTNQTFWVRRPGFYTNYAGEIYSIREKYPGGNYYVEFYSSFPPNETVIMEIDRQTGQEIPGTSWRYVWEGGGTSFVRPFILSDSSIYSFMDGFFSTSFERPGLVCISASDGQPKWWQMSHLPLTDSARLRGEDFILDNDAIVNVSSGNDQGVDLSKSFIFLQKTALNGDILWVKRYDLPDFPAERPREVVRVSDGYIVFGEIVFGFLNPNSDLFMLKTDLDGNVLWAHRFDYSARDGVNPLEPQDEFLEMDGFFYFTAYSLDASGATTDWLLAKVDSEGFAGDSCAYLTATPVMTYPILNPVKETPPLSFRNMDIDFVSPVPANTTTATDVSGYRTICEHICKNEEGCDIKINGCVKFELLSIVVDADGNRHYRVRFTNSCAGQNLDYLAIQLPDGTVAVEPAEGGVYTTENGHNYTVRNPNYSPFYSIRFKSQGAGIGNGQSDVFEYTLIGQSQPAYINVFARLWPGPSYEAHLNVFNCPVQTQSVQNRSDNISSLLSVTPNPVTDLLTVTFSESGDGHWQIFDLDGREVSAGAWSKSAGFTASVTDLPAGIYFIRLYKAGE